MFSESAGKAVGLTRLLGKSLPPSKISFIGIVVVSFLIGMVTSAISSEDISYGGVRAVFLIAVPSLLGAVACISLKRSIRYKRIMFLAFASSLLYGLFYVLHFGGIAVGLGADYETSFHMLLVANAFIFALWYVTARIAFSLKYSSLLFGLITPTLNVMFLLADKSMAVGSPESISVLTKLYFASLIFLAAIYGLFWLINAPMKRNFGVSLTEAASLFLAQWFEASPKLEAMFDEVGENVTTLLGVLAFKTKGRLKAVFLVPHIHFGPFGSLGGSEFPALFADEVKRRTGAQAFVFHGCATHDFNPVAKGEIEKFNEKLFKALGSMRFEKARGWLAVGRSGASKTQAVMVNGILFAPLTRAPRTTEDVDFSVGLAIRNYALAKGAKEALVLDAHNAETGEIMRVESGNPIVFEYMEAVGDALSKAGKESRLRLGIAHDPLEDFGIQAGIGGGGLNVAVFKANRKRFAFVLFDANGATPNFRRDVIDAVRGLGIDECEVLTTDTHSVNKVGGVLNPVGSNRANRRELIMRTIRAVQKAVSDLEEVEVAGSLQPVEGVKIFGVTQSSELIGTVNSIVAVVRIIAPIVLICATAAALWAMTKI